MRKAAETAARRTQAERRAKAEERVLDAQWSIGKSFGTHGPIGPWLVTPDELGDPHDLDVRTLVNGEVRQL